MKKNKANIVCAVICAVITAALIGLAVFGIVKNNIEKEREKTLNEYEQVQQDNNAHYDETDNTDTPEQTDKNEPSETIPGIKDDPTIPDVQGQPNIDVGEMTRNPEAEVVDSKVEYGTKEADANAE